MATIATQRKRTRVSRKWIIGIVVALIVLGAVGAWLMTRGANGNAAAETPGWTTAAANTGTIDAAVSATGSVEAQAQADLRFAADGTVTEILVKPGQQVQAGQPLARLDATDLQLAVEQAQADLKQAQADYQQLMDKASPQEISAAQARVAQAQGQYQQAAGSVTRADIAAARAQLDAAKAKLASLQAGHTGASDADLSLQSAQNQLAAKRDQLSLEKANAQNALQQRVNDLTKAQAAYSTAQQNWQYVQDTGRDPITPSTTNAQGASKPNRLNDAQRQQYYQAFVQAEADLRSAEAAVQQAQVAYDGARQAEITGMQAAERDVATAQAAVDKQRSGGAAEELAAARAAVETAQAQLNQLTGSNRSGNVAAAQAGVDIAQAELEKLTNDPSASDLARAEAGVARNQAALKVAQHQLDQATMLAPFAATIARIDLRVGERAGETGVIAIADLSSFHIDIPVDELDVAQIKPGQPVKIALDALPGQDLTGAVTTIDPLATQTDKGTNTYKVVVTITAADSAVRPGMTAAAQIVTQHKEGIVLVPRRAVQSENGQSFVLIPKEGPIDPATQTPANDKRPVTIGLSNSESVEIASGLKPGEKVLVKDVVSTIVPQNGP
jgi:RND family efflux transporter MFP subunit